MKKLSTWIRKVFKGLDFLNYFADPKPELDETHSSTREAMAPKFYDIHDAIAHEKSNRKA